MLRRDEIVRSLTGAWSLFLDRSDAMRHFDVSADGFWRSFYVIVLILPAYALIALSEQGRILADPVLAAGFDSNAFVINKSLTLVFNWIMLPVVLALAAPPLGVSRSYAAFIVARNWGTFISVSLFALMDVLFLLGILGERVAGYMFLLTFVVVIRYDYLIARRALGVDIPFAIGVVVGDFAISLAIFSVANSFIGYGGAFG